MYSLNDFIGPLLILLGFGGLSLLAPWQLTKQHTPSTDTSQFRHILALLSSTRLVIAIRQATRT